MDRNKLKAWLYFYDIKEAEDLLVDKVSYLILHEDYDTPMVAQYHDDILPNFTFYTADGLNTVFLYDKKITLFAELLSRDVYYEFINICN